MARRGRKVGLLGAAVGVLIIIGSLTGVLPAAITAALTWATPYVLAAGQWFGDALTGLLMSGWRERN